VQAPSVQLRLTAPLMYFEHMGAFDGLHDGFSKKTYPIGQIAVDFDFQG
jgi:hypothetical protein